jgi:CRP-like cAMP-binding protein
MTERPQLRVATATTEEERWRVFRFRYASLVEDQNVDSPAADHENRILYDAVDDDAVIFYLTEKNRIIATARIAPLNQMRFPAWQSEAFQFENFDDFAPAAKGFTSRFISDREWRGSPALAVLFGALYKFARERGVRFLFLNSPPSQIHIFERLGYRRLGGNFRNEAGFQVPLVLLLDDLQHMAAIDSPFRRLAMQYKNSTETANWFASAFPGLDALGTRPNMTEDDFWAYLTQRLDQIPIAGVPLLEGLSFTEAKQFLNVGTVLNCAAGDPIIRSGDIGDEMFVLLSGSAEVRGTDGGEPLALLEKGDVFGELGFLAQTPRSAHVVAADDLEVLILTQEFLRKAMEKMPEVSLKVLFNLSLVLCGRLKNTTESLLDATAPERLEPDDAAPADDTGVEAAPLRAAR